MKKKEKLILAIVSAIISIFVSVLLCSTIVNLEEKKITEEDYKTLKDYADFKASSDPYQSENKEKIPWNDEFENLESDSKLEETEGRLYINVFSEEKQISVEVEYPFKRNDNGEIIVGIEYGIKTEKTMFRFNVIKYFIIFFIIYYFVLWGSIRIIIYIRNKIVSKKKNSFN